MTQKIKQGGISIMSSPENASCSMIFNNLTGKNFSGQEYKNYLNMMFNEFPCLTYGEIELWEGEVLKHKGVIKKL